LHEPLIVDLDEDANGHVIDIVVERAAALATRKAAAGGLQRVLIVTYTDAYRAAFEQRLRTIARRQNLPTLPDRVTVALLPTWLASASGHRARPGGESPDDFAAFVPVLVAQVSIPPKRGGFRYAASALRASAIHRSYSIGARPSQAL
jgi:hypothetical protein